MLWSIPGAVTFSGVADIGRVGDVLADLRAGRLSNLVFAMPSGRSWALPLYEVALLGAAELDEIGDRRTRLTVLTPEHKPLEIFGRHTAEQMGELLEERGIEVIAGAHPVEFEGRRLRVAPVRTSWLTR
jgi:sulfide:quinone oxidoreductase